jgi:DNA mismatch endonuclease, patch repair protein
VNLALASARHWHGHERPLFNSQRREFWAKKIAGNRKQDQRRTRALPQAGWHVLIVWECSLKGEPRDRWLKSQVPVSLLAKRTTAGRVRRDLSELQMGRK